MADFPWDDDGEGNDESLRNMEARIRAVMVKMHEDLKAVIGEWQAELLEILSDFDDRIRQLELRQSTAWHDSDVAMEPPA